MFPKKQKTFHTSVPECSNCQGADEICHQESGSDRSISTDAVDYMIKCESGSTEQPSLVAVVPELNVPQSGGTEVEVTKAPDAREICSTHGKLQKLFCQTCSVLICGDCFGSGEGHVRHSIGNVDLLYQEQRDAIEKTLREIGEGLKVMQADSALCRKNLAAVEEREKCVLAEIEEVGLQAKASVAALTAERIAGFKRQMALADQKQQDVAALQGKVQKLHPVDFLKQGSEIRGQCNELLGNKAVSGFTQAPVEDIGCDLVPPFSMQTFKLADFSKTELWNLSLTAKYDILWNVRVRKGENITVQVWPCDPQFVNYSFEVLVVVPDKDYSKQIHRTFAHRNKEIILPTAQCVCEHDILVIQVGIRLRNALVGNKLLEEQNSSLKPKYSKMEKQFKSTKSILDALTIKFNDVEQQLLSVKNSCDYKFFTMCFNVHLTNLNYTQHSTKITDPEGRLWNMLLRSSNSDIEAHVSLYSGTTVRCRYFVELEHQTNPTRNIRKCETAWFFQKTSNGWGEFVSLDTVKADFGYCSLSGVLRFRFGVQPQLSDSKLLSKMLVAALAK